MKVCGEYFYPDNETLALMSDGYLSPGDLNTCYECWEMLYEVNMDDTVGIISDADPGL